MRLSAILLSCVLLSASLLPVPALQADDAACRSLLNVYCTRCHTSRRICDALAVKNEVKWQTTIRTMAGFDEDIDPATQEQVLDCVNGATKSEFSFCNQ